MVLINGAASRVPVYGYPEPGAESYRIAYFGDPWLGAGLAKRHEVLWTRRDEAKHISSLERPDFLLITPRAEALRALRTKPLVGLDGSISDDLLAIIDTFKRAGIPVAFTGVTGSREFDRYLAIAKMVDVVGARTTFEANRYEDAGCRNVNLAEPSAFGFASPVLPSVRAGQTALLAPYELTTGGVLVGGERGTDIVNQSGSVPMIREGADHIHTARVGLEKIREAAWIGKQAFSSFGRVAALALEANAWPTSAPTLYEAVLHGVMPIVFGNSALITERGGSPAEVPQLDSLESCVTFGESLGSIWGFERQRRLAALVSDRRLSDDWVRALLGGVGVPERVERVPLALDGTLATNSPTTLAALAKIVQPDAVTVRHGVRGIEAEDELRWPLCTSAPVDDDRWEGLLLSVLDVASFDAGWLDLLFGWRRVTRSRSVGVRDQKGKLIATLLDRREGATCMIEQDDRPGVLAEAEVIRECA